MEIEIIKFGGLALANGKNQIKCVDIVRSYKREKIIVVVSAMGRNGYAYSTDSLAMLVEGKTIDCEMARLLSCGEIISSIRFSYLLQKEGINSISLSPNKIGIITDNNYLNSKIIKLDNSIIYGFLTKFDLLVIPGFLGVNEDNQITTLGRGNSDLSAVLIAKMLKQKKVTLFKDVDGIYHTSPEQYNQLEKYKNISYDEMICLCKIGFSVVSEDAVRSAKENNIVIVVKTYKEALTGSEISNKESNDLCLGFNVINKVIKIASMFPCLIKEELIEQLHKEHIFVKNECIDDCSYSFEIPKSMINIAKRVIITTFLQKKA